MTKKFSKFISIALILVLLVGATILPVGATETNADINFTPGQLELTKAPSFQFGSQALSVVAKTYTGTVVDNIVVTDARGSKAGWNLSVTLAEFKDGAAATSLAGSELVFTNGTYVGGGVATPPTTIPATAALIAGGASAPVVKALANEGAGVITSTPSVVTLAVPLNQGSLGAHNAKLTWTLANTP